MTFTTRHWRAIGAIAIGMAMCSVGAMPARMAAAQQAASAAPAVSAVSGELRQWHKVTLISNGPQANETDASPNPFTDYRMTVTFTHESSAGGALKRGSEAIMTGGRKVGLGTAPDNSTEDWLVVVRR